MANDNRDRLLRVIRGLQLLQRTNAPKSSIFKAAGKALAPLHDELAAMPAPAVLTAASVAASVPRGTLEDDGLPLAGNHVLGYAQDSQT